MSHKNKNNPSSSYPPPYRRPPTNPDIHPDPGLSYSSSASSESSFYRPPSSAVSSSSRGGGGPWSQDGALSILSSCGLEPSDLVLLAGLPEDALTVETLPHLLTQIKGKRGTVKPFPENASPTLSPSASLSTSYPTAYPMSCTQYPDVNATVSTVKNEWERPHSSSQAIQYPAKDHQGSQQQRGLNVPELDRWGNPIALSCQRTKIKPPPKQKPQQQPIAASSASSGYVVDFHHGSGPPEYSQGTSHDFKQRPEAAHFDHFASEGFQQQESGRFASSDYGKKGRDAIPDFEDFQQRSKPAKYDPFSSSEGFSQRPTSTKNNPVLSEDYQHRSKPANYDPFASGDFHQKPSGPSEFGKKGRDNLNTNPSMAFQQRNTPAKYDPFSSSEDLHQKPGKKGREGVLLSSQQGGCGGPSMAFTSPPSRHQQSSHPSRFSDVVSPAQYDPFSSSEDLRQKPGKKGRDQISPLSTQDFQQRPKAPRYDPFSSEDLQRRPTSAHYDPVLSQNFHDKPGPSDFGKKGREAVPLSSQQSVGGGPSTTALTSPPSRHRQQTSHPPSRFCDVVSAQPSFLPKPVGDPEGSSLPFKQEAQDFHGTAPTVFPYRCSLCDITVMSEKVWIKHINNSQHADGQLALLQRFPHWDCRLESVIGAENQSEKRKDKGKPGRQPQQADQKSKTHTNKKATKKTSEKSRVVCVKFPAQSVDEAYMNTLAQPFGKIVKILMFPTLAFVELGSVDQAKDLVNYHNSNPHSVSGKPLEFRLSSTFNFLQSSQVLSFCPAPSGDVDQSDLISVIKRFGEPLYTLFLPSKAFVELKTAAEAQKMMDYYSNQTLKINSESVSVSFSGEYKSLMRVASAKRYSEESFSGQTKTRSSSGEKDRNTEREKDRNTEREKDRHTEREKDRHTERERDRHRERERDRHTEREKDRHTETQRRKGSSTKRNTTRATSSRSPAKSTRENESRTRTRSRSREEARKDGTDRSRSSSMSRKENTERTTRSRSRDKSSKDKTDRTERTKSLSTEKSTEENQSRSTSQEISTEKVTSKSVSTSKEQPDTDPGPAPLTQSEPETEVKVKQEPEDEEDAESSSDDSDIEGMAVIGEDGESVSEEEEEEEQGDEKESETAEKDKETEVQMDGEKTETTEKDEEEKEQGDEEKTETAEKDRETEVKMDGEKTETAEKDIETELKTDGEMNEEEKEEEKPVDQSEPQLKDHEAEADFLMDLENCIVMDELAEDQSDAEDRDTDPGPALQSEPEVKQEPEDEDAEASPDKQSSPHQTPERDLTSTHSTDERQTSTRTSEEKYAPDMSPENEISHETSQKDDSTAKSSPGTSDGETVPGIESEFKNPLEEAEEESIEQPVYSSEGKSPLSRFRPSNRTIKRKVNDPENYVNKEKKKKKKKEEEEEEEECNQEMDSTGPSTLLTQQKPSTGLESAVKEEPQSEPIGGDREQKRPTKPVGSEFISPVVGYFCSLCESIYVTEDEAKDTHCSSTEHYSKYMEKTGKDPWTS